MLELMKFEFAVGLLSEMEEYERAVLIFQNVSGETVSAAIKVAMLL